MKAPEISYTYAERDSMRYASYFHRKKREGGERESERGVTAMGCKELGNISDTSNSLLCLSVRCVRDIPQLLASRHGRDSVDGTPSSGVI